MRTSRGGFRHTKARPKRRALAFLTAGTISGKTLWQPHGSAIDNIHHRLFLADTGNNRVLVFNLDANGALTNISAAFVLGQSSFDQNAACYPGPAGAASICAPTNVAVDSSGNRLFVVEGSNNRIL